VRARILLLSLVATAGAQEVNPVHPEAAVLLRERAACVGFAVEAGDALLARGRETEHGLAFAADGDSTVYAGDAGVAILFAGLFRATGDAKWSRAARRTLEDAVARGAAQPGLYTGLAGIGEACLLAHEATDDAWFLAQARACAAKLPAAWPATDVISGAAGTGIFLLNLHRVTGDEADLAAARRAGVWLAERARREDGKASWPVAPGSPRVYLGFSHGAAGVGTFLWHLGARTGDARYTALAREAAAFVRAYALPEGKDGALWERTVPPTPDDTIRIQWCHGSPGNGLFFAVLAGDDEASLDALRRCVCTTRRLGRTARRGGCQCHGVAGNAELFLEAWRVLRDDTLLEDARTFASSLLEPRGDGFALDTGYAPSYMLGLAGIGHFFLRLADPEKAPFPCMVRPLEKVAR